MRLDENKKVRGWTSKKLRFQPCSLITGPNAGKVDLGGSYYRDNGQAT
jgi:hypothetical protein